jgi:flagellar basal-body rod protein FlgB
MALNIFNSTTIPLVEQVVNFSQARHNVLAGNIANLDTPGYHVRDLSQEMFQTRLKEALAQRERTDTQVSAGGAAARGPDPLAGLGKSVNAFLHHDDTNASLEGQVTEIAKNQLQHNVALSILTSQFRLLQAAVSERA